MSVCVTLFLCFCTYRCRCLRARPHRWYLSVRYRDSRMLGQSAVSTQKRFYFQYSSEFKVQSACAVSGHRGITPDVLHSRFGHCGARRLRQSVTRSANFPRHESLDHDPTDCDACQEGGARRRPFPKRVKQQFTMFGQRLSSDLCGPFPESIGGHKYALCIVDAADHWKPAVLIYQGSCENFDLKKILVENLTENENRLRTFQVIFR